jgi:hypothetical protein
MPKIHQTVHPFYLQKHSAALFNKTRFSGREIASRLHYVPNTIFVQFKRFGLPTARALEVADLLTEWAQELLGLAIELRKLAADPATKYPPPISGMVECSPPVASISSSAPLSSFLPDSWDSSSGEPVPQLATTLSEPTP